MPAKDTITRPILDEDVADTLREISGEPKLGPFVNELCRCIAEAKWMHKLAVDSGMSVLQILRLFLKSGEAAEFEVEFKTSKTLHKDENSKIIARQKLNRGWKMF